MYDELIKRLRETSIDFGESDHVSVMMIEAADAIEELIRVAEVNVKRALKWAADAEKAAEKIRWIPVTERLPEYDKVVQITDGVEVGHGYLEGIDTTIGVTSFWHSPFCDIDETHISHWMPLPQPPESEGE